MMIRNFIGVHGNNIPNQFVIEYSLNKTAFQSYKTLVAVYLHDVDAMNI